MIQGKISPGSGDKNRIIELTAENVGEATKGLPFHARFALKQLTRMHFGSLTVRIPDGSTFHFKAAGKGPEAEVVLQ